MMNNGEVAAQGAGADFQDGEVVGAGVHVASGIGSGDGVTVANGVINGQGVTVGSGEGMGTGMFAGKGEGTGMMAAPRRAASTRRGKKTSVLTWDGMPAWGEAGGRTWTGLN